MKILKKISLAIAILLGLASVARCVAPTAKHPTVMYRQEACLVPGLDSWHKTHVLSFPYSANEYAISCIQLVGKKNSEDIPDYFPGGVRPAGCLFCFDVLYDLDTGMMSIFLAEENNCDEWSDHLCDSYEWEKAISEFVDGIEPRYPWDEWFYPGYIQDPRRVDFLEWISIRLEK